MEEAEGSFPNEHS